MIGIFARLLVILGSLVWVALMFVNTLTSTQVDHSFWLITAALVGVSYMVSRPPAKPKAVEQTRKPMTDASGHAIEPWHTPAYLEARAAWMSDRGTEADLRRMTEAMEGPWMYPSDVPRLPPNPGIRSRS